MTPLDTLSWEGMGRYGMGYLTKYTTPFRLVLIIEKIYRIIDSLVDRLREIKKLIKDKDATKSN